MDNNPDPDPANRYTIGTLARAASVNLETVRFYQRKGLVREPPRDHGTIRRYGAPDLARVRFIKSAQRLGFSLDEIAGLLRLDDGAHCREARTLAQARLDDVRTRLSDLQQIERVLGDLVRRCASARGAVSCPLIASLQQT